MIVVRLVAFLFIRVWLKDVVFCLIGLIRWALLGPNIYQMAPKMPNFLIISRPRSVSDVFSELLNMSTTLSEPELKSQEAKHEAGD